jgi:hypothetical protein
MKTRTRPKLAIESNMESKQWELLSGDEMVASALISIHHSKERSAPAEYFPNSYFQPVFRHARWADPPEELMCPFHRVRDFSLPDGKHIG